MNYRYFLIQIGSSFQRQLFAVFESGGPDRLNLGQIHTRQFSAILKSRFADRFQRLA